MGSIGQEHIGKGAPVLVVAVGLEGDFLPKGEGRALSPNPVKLWGATWASNQRVRGGTSRTTQSLRSIHNLHNIYEEFTGLERVPVRLETRVYAGTREYWRGTP
jgi:hypothetical protein